MAFGTSENDTRIDVLDPGKQLAVGVPGVARGVVALLDSGDSKTNNKETSDTNANRLNVFDLTSIVLSYK